MPQVTVINGPTIQAGQSVSDTLDLSTNTLAQVVIPDNWSKATLTMQASPDNVTFYDVFHMGQEARIYAEPGTLRLVESDIGSSIMYLRFRSGTRDYPINQAETVVFKCLVKA